MNLPKEYFHKIKKIVLEYHLFSKDHFAKLETLINFFEALDYNVEKKYIWQIVGLLFVSRYNKQH